MFLAFTDCDQELKALRLVPHRARDDSTQLSLEVVDGHHLRWVLSVASKDTEEQLILLEQVEALFERLGRVRRRWHATSAAM